MCGKKIGGIQVILVGDFFQLSPVLNELYGNPGKHCFMLPWFNEFFPIKILYYWYFFFFKYRMERREYSCASCGGRPSSPERLPASSFAEILYKLFSVNAIETDILCNKCRHKCRNILRRKQTLDINDEDDAKDPTFRSLKRSKCIQVHVSNPPSIALLLLSSSRSHSYFFVCKKPGPKLLSVSINQARMDVFVARMDVFVRSEMLCRPFN